MKIAAKVIISAFLAVAFVPSVLLAEGTESKASAHKLQDLPDVLDRVTASSAEDQEGGDASVNGVPSSVSKVVKRLSTQAKGLTLDDLNSAREASAKLDALLDIERKLTDLAKLRQDRDMATSIENSSKFEATIPMSALAAPRPVISTPSYLMPSAPASTPVSAPAPAPAPASASASTSAPASVSVSSHAPRPFPSYEGPKEVDIMRVSGTSGKYVAVYKGISGEDIQVRQGDKMQDESVVQSVTRRGVTLAKNKKTVTLQVKGVSNIFGAE